MLILWIIICSFLGSIGALASAAGFLYIALVDLYPQLHQKIEFRSSIQQILMILAGIGTMILLLQFHPS